MKLLRENRGRGFVRKARQTIRISPFLVILFLLLLFVIIKPKKRRRFINQPKTRKRKWKQLLHQRQKNSTVESCPKHSSGYLRIYKSVGTWVEFDRFCTEEEIGSLGTFFLLSSSEIQSHLIKSLFRANDFASFCIRAILREEKKEETRDLINLLCVLGKSR